LQAVWLQWRYVRANPYIRLSQLQSVATICRCCKGRHSNFTCHSLPVVSDRRSVCSYCNTILIPH
jgi:hypothetical protein